MRFLLRNQKVHSFLSRSPPSNPFDNRRTYCIWGFGREFTMATITYIFLGSLGFTTSQLILMGVPPVWRSSGLAFLRFGVPPVWRSSGLAFLRFEGRNIVRAWTERV